MGKIKREKDDSRQTKALGPIGPIGPMVTISIPLVENSKLPPRAVSDAGKFSGVSCLNATLSIIDFTGKLSNDFDGAPLKTLAPGSQSINQNTMRKIII